MSSLYKRLHVDCVCMCVCICELTVRLSASLSGFAHKRVNEQVIRLMTTAATTRFPRIIAEPPDVVHIHAAATDFADPGNNVSMSSSSRLDVEEYAQQVGLDDLEQFVVAPKRGSHGSVHLTHSDEDIDGTAAAVADPTPHVRRISVSQKH